LEFLGTKGSLGISRSGFTVTPDADVPPASLIPQYEVHPVGGPTTVKPPADRRDRTERIEDKSGDGRWQYVDHVRNFLDCIKSRMQPISDLESGHRTATACHLANIALRLGRMIRWDAKRETTVGDSQAANWLVRPYRAPWDKELKALAVGASG
jgi:hypothetical protein